MSKYIFKLEEDYYFKSKKVLTEEVLTRLKEDLKFPDQDDKTRLEIKLDGTIIVKKDYAWDGCSPKLNVLDLFWVGTPDGALNQNKPITYYASLVHDALGQFAKKEPERMPFNRKERDLIFKEMLEGFAFKWVYYLAVRIFGGIYSKFF